MKKSKTKSILTIGIFFATLFSTISRLIIFGENNPYSGEPLPNVWYDGLVTKLLSFQHPYYLQISDRTDDILSLLPVIVFFILTIVAVYKMYDGSTLQSRMWWLLLVVLLIVARLAYWIPYWYVNM